MRELTAAEVARAVGGQVVAGPQGVRVRGVSTDSRRTEPGRLFVALRGERLDGHAFIAEAVARGAAAVVARREVALAMAGGEQGWALIAVDDTLEALQRLAAWHRGRLAAPVVAVTGSVGKTTTKDMAAAILARSRPVVRAPASYNNEVGVPLAVLEADEGTGALVLELGMRGPGHIRALAAIARPHVGVITNVGEAHIGLLGSLEATARAKGELLEALEPGGTAVLNADDPLVMSQARRLPAGCRRITFGLGEVADVQVQELSGGGPSGTRFRLRSPWGPVSCRLPLPGRHLAANAAAAAAAAFVLGASPDDVAAALASFSPAAMRMETVEAGGVLILNDAYNASPPSMKAALETLAAVRAERGGRAAAVLGDMLELGPYAPEAHRRVGEQAARAGVDLLVVVGEMAPHTARGAREAGLCDERLRVVGGIEEAAQEVARWMAPGDAVLVKGSRAVGLERVVAALAARQAG